MRPFRLKMMRSVAVVATAVIPSHLAAQQEALFTWTGRAAPDVEITIRGAQVSTTTVQDRYRSDRIPERRGFPVGTTRLQNALPQESGTITLAASNDQVVARVIQQPGADNDYTAVIGVADRSGLGDPVRVSVYWTGAAHNDRYGRAERRSSNGEVIGDRRSSGAGRLRWVGDVDGTAELRLRDSHITAYKLSGRDLRNVGGGSGMSMPERPMDVSVRVREGRGNVVVTQQPSAANGYTATIRVDDPARGYGHYDFDIVWR